MKHFTRLALSALAVFAVIAYTAVPQPAQAQSSASLSIVPKKNYTIDAGESIKDKLTIRNLDTERSLNLSLKVIDFTYNDDTGTPKLMLDEDAPQTTWSLKDYLTIPESVTIEPSSSQTFDISVAIPAGLGAGSYYSAVMYSSSAPDGGNVGLSASGVTLVFVNVPGEVNELLTLQDFGAYRRAEDGVEPGYTFFTFDEPQVMAYTLKNDGNVTESPAGTITVRHMFGKEWTLNDVNPSKSLALIGQSRTFTSCIKLTAEEVDFNGTRSEAETCTSPGLWPGFYSANLSLFYGQNGNNTEEVTGTAYFWYFPAWFIIVFTLALAFVGYHVWRIVQKIKGRSHGPQRGKIRRKQ